MEGSFDREWFYSPLCKPIGLGTVTCIHLLCPISRIELTHSIVPARCNTISFKGT